MLILLCFFVLAGVLDDLPSRKLRLFSLLAIVLTAVSHVSVISPVHFAFTARDDPASALTTLVIMVSALFVLRSWCRYLCPWGYLLGYVHRFSRVRILRRLDQCIACGACNDVCDVAAIDKGAIRHEHCHFCHSCVDRCPNGGLEVVDVWQEPAQAPAATPASGKEGAAA
jgi:polyferredoxin